MDLDGMDDMDDLDVAADVATSGLGVIRCSRASEAAA
jgi:hypothetical protein